MAYQNVGTPRFYINDIFYAKSIGIDISDVGEHLLVNNLPYYYDISFEDYHKIIDGIPQPAVNFDTEVSQHRIKRLRYKVIKKRDDRPHNYVALLNHNLGTNKIGFRSTWRIPEEDYIDGESHWNGANDLSEIVNANFGSMDFYNYISSNFGQPLYDGFSIWGMSNGSDSGNNSIIDFTFSPSDLNFGGTSDSDGNYYPIFQVGSIFQGRYYDMPHSPELDLRLVIENDGYKSVQTKGGTHLADYDYIGAPDWRTAAPWTVHGEYADARLEALGRRRGRRVWYLNFSQINKEDIFSPNYMGNRYTSSQSDNTEYNTNNELSSDGNSFEYNFEDDDSFISSVLNKVGNGQRFIFQPDNTNNNPDQFALCQLDQNSIQVTQVASGVFDFSLTIREIW